MQGSAAIPHRTPVLLQALLDDAAHFRQHPDAAAPMRQTDLLGLIFGRFVELAARPDDAVEAKLDLRRCADLLAEIVNSRGARFSVGTVADGSIQLFTRHCPFTDGATDAPHLCEVAIGAMGTLAARNLGYGKVELRRRITSSDCCEIWIHTDASRAATHPGCAYRWVDGRICVEPGRSLADLETAAHGIRNAAVLPKPVDADSAPVIVARSEAMRGVLRAIETVAPAQTTVLVTGETGVGKELVARSLHALSPRAKRPFVAINCGAVPENLIESVLFGHEKGAFTGAHERHAGVFERAEGGTLFLDEIDTLPLAAQTRLLRVLQESEFERVGGSRQLVSNVRVVAACNADLEDRVAHGRFRRDLYYRINVVGIAIPPLRERREDIPPLIEHILRDMRRKHAMHVREISLGGMAELIAHDWPGNVRELENVIERSCLFCTGTRLTRVDLGRAACRMQLASPAAHTSASSLRDQRRRAMDELEQNVLCDELRQAGGNVPEVAKRMGITPRAVYLKLQRFGIDPASFRG